MTEASPRAARARPREDAPPQSVDRPPRNATPSLDSDGEEAERRLGRVVALAAPLTTVVVAIIVGAVLSLGQALLVLAAGALFGTVAFLWASLRTLGGQAPLAEGFDQLSRRRIESPEGPAERKRKALRALKDLAFEHEVGKLDDADYAELSAHYRDEAKAVMREIDDDATPQRERAEEVARAYLAKRAVSGERGSRKARTAKKPLRAPPEDPPIDSAPRPRAELSEPGSRRACPSCESSNERDAAFCKGCGARLAPVACSYCSTVNEPDAAFCKRCGKSVGATLEGKTDAPP
jgi:hypothetical protein